MVTKNKLKAFTIVELLIVIVVIGILAAITLVSFNGVTQRANKAANQSNAQSVISAAEAVRGDTGSYPAASQTQATMITNLNASVVKVPSNILVTGQTSGAALATLPTATNGNVMYVPNNTTPASATGICVFYYDTVNLNIASLTSGVATAATTPTTLAGATCV